MGLVTGMVYALDLDIRIVIIIIIPLYVGDIWVLRYSLDNGGINYMYLLGFVMGMLYMLVMILKGICNGNIIWFCNYYRTIVEHDRKLSILISHWILQYNYSLKHATLNIYYNNKY